MTTEKKPDKTLALAAVAAILTIVAATLVAAIVGRDWIRAQLEKTAPTPSPAAKTYELRRLDFPGMTQAQRDAFDVAILHDDALREWWYLNAHLYDQFGNRFTLMIAMLKDGRLFGIVAEHTADITIPILDPKTTVAHDPYTRSYTIGEATIRQPDPKYLCYTFDFKHERLALNLEVCANKPPLIVDHDGQVRMGEKGHSWYYSVTNANIRGTGTLDDKAVTLQGRAWMDRQWGNWFVDDFDRWDWYSLQLDGDTELLLFVFWKGDRIIHKFGDVYLPDGSAKHDLKFNITPTSTWFSPRTGISWETSWTISIPAYRAQLIVTADFPDHEVDEVLWEGGVEIGGRWGGAPAKGRGFFEARRRGAEEKR